MSVPSPAPAPARRGIAPRWAAHGALAAGLSVALAGCISLLPTEKPVQLYRFGAGAPPAAAEASAAARPQSRFGVRLAPIGFDPPAAADRILTVKGDQTAYVAGARWVTAAGTLFRAAVTHAFDSHGGPAHLLAFGEPTPADLVLKVDVRAFEVSYTPGGGDPAVVVEVYGALDDLNAPHADKSRLFQARVPAASNSVHAITAAFDQAVAKVLTDLVAWVDARGAG